MQKKSFKSNNPVMQFISPETVEKIEESTETTSNKDVQQITAEFEALFEVSPTETYPDGLDTTGLNL